MMEQATVALCLAGLGTPSVRVSPRRFPYKVVGKKRQSSGEASWPLRVTSWPSLKSAAHPSRQ